MAQPVVYATTTRLRLTPAAGDAELRSAIRAFTTCLLASLSEEGCTLVGHIKGSLDGGTLGFSVTTLDGEPSFSGSAEAVPSSLKLNVIVYGVDEQRVAAAVRRCLSALE